MAKQAKVKEERLEDILFSCRNHLRGRAPMTDKRDLLLTLVFLKFIGDRFNEQRDIIFEENKEDPDFAKFAVTKSSFYKKAGVFFVQDDYRWEELIKKRA